MLARGEEHDAAARPPIVVVGELLHEQERGPYVHVQVLVEIGRCELLECPEPAQRVVHDEDVDVAQSVTRSAHDRRGRLGIREVGFRMCDGASRLPQFVEHRLDAARIRALVFCYPRVDENAVACLEEPASDGEADPVPPADTCHDRGSRHEALSSRPTCRRCSWAISPSSASTR